MAKVKGPLMSMDARGQIAKALVFLGWKGLKTVRGYVVPANPNTTAQQGQRGHMTTAVAAWHTAAFNTLDVAAWNVLASVQSMIMSGFNVFCKLWIQEAILADAIVVPTGMTISANTGGTVSISIAATGTLAGKVRFGSSASVMSESAALTKAAGGDPYTGDMTGLVAGDYVYFQLYTETAASYIFSGIYKVLVLA